MAGNRENYLIFCSYEVGGLPFKMAHILNRYGVNAYYISIAKTTSGHDSSIYHYGNIPKNWNLTSQFEKLKHSQTKVIGYLKEVIARYHIKHCLAIGAKAYYVRKAGLDYFYWSYGGDLDHECLRPAWLDYFSFFKKCIHYPNYILRTRKRARKAFQESKKILLPPPHRKDIVERLFPHKSYFRLPHFMETYDFEYLKNEKEMNKDRIAHTIDAERFLFSPARHEWCGHYRNSNDNKRNDVVILSFARYLQLSSDNRTKLILIIKGHDVDNSKQLIRNLGIEENVVWLSEMRRDELNPFYRGASLCFGEFGAPVLSFAVIEPLVHATPCISHVANTELYDQMPPIFNSTDVDQISKYIHEMMNNKEIYLASCRASWLWVIDNCSEKKFSEKFVSIFNE